MKTGFMGLAAVFLSATFAVAQYAPLQKDVPPKVIATCVECHGLQGNSVSSGVPRLNGQQAEYMKARLKSFIYPGNQDPHATAAMWGVVSAIDDPTLVAIAGYYSRQTPTPPQVGRPLAGAGQKLFESGDAAEFVPACQSCHGMRAEGRGAVPRLAGQHADYLKNQLERLRLGLRASEVMHPKVMNLTDAQIAALVAYLSKD